MAKRIKLGRCAGLPLRALGGYVLSGLLLCIGGAQPFGTDWRMPVMVLAIIAFLAGAVVQVLKKIEDSVGDVWNSGERAGVRHEALRRQARNAALVRSEPRLAVVPDRGSC